MEKIIIVGAGSGGRIVSELARQQRKFRVLGFLDDDKQLQGAQVNGYKVIGTSADLNKFKGLGFLISIGVDIAARSAVFKSAVKAKLRPVKLIHKTAVIDKTAEIGEGSIILANCIVNPFTRVGKNCFVFTGTILEHDNRIGNNVYFSPGVILAGGVSVGNNSFFGIGSCVTQGIKIGSKVIVGAGSVVLKNIPDNLVVAGVPAKVLRRNDR